MTDARAFRRDDVLAIAVILLLVTALFADVLFTERTLYYGDLTLFFRGATAALRSIVLGGEFPEWNPFFSGGQPMAANPEFGTFYPLHYLVLLPDFDFAWDLHLIVHIWIAALAMYALLRSMELCPAASVLGGISFGLGGFVLSYLTIPPFLFTLAWLPLTLLLTRRMLQKPTPRNFAFAAASMGLQFLAGEPTTALQTVILIGAYGLYRGATGHSIRAALRSVALIALLVIAGLLAGAIQILPMIDHAGQTVRAEGLTFEQVRSWSLPPARVAEFFVPGFMGPLENNQRLYWGRSLYRDWTGPYFPRIYFGIIPAILALAGVIARVRGSVLFVSVAVLSFLLAIGDHTPLLRLLHSAGVFSTFRYPEKFILAGVVGAIIFAAATFHECLSGNRRALRATIGVAAGLALIGTAAWLASFTGAYARAWAELWTLPPDSIIEYTVGLSARSWLSMAAHAGAFSAILLAGLGGRRSRAGVTAAAVIALLVVDLAPLGRSVAPRIGEDFFEAPPLALNLDRDRERYRIFHEADLLEQLPPRDQRTRWPGHLRYAQFRYGLYGRLATAFGFQTVLENDYDLSNVRATTSFFSAFMAATQEGSSHAADLMLRMSGVRYRLRPRASRSPHTPVTADRVAGLPRYYFADQLVSIRTGGEFLERLRTWTGSDRVAFVGFRAFLPGRGRIDSAEISTQSAVMTVSASAPSFLVASVTFDRYWSAAIDGTQVQIHRTNLGYQGVVVPAGAHTITFAYSNPLIRAGAAISIAALLAIGLLLAKRSR